jgi:hypothetical protein
MSFATRRTAMRSSKRVVITVLTGSLTACAVGDELSSESSALVAPAPYCAVPGAGTCMTNFAPDDSTTQSDLKCGTSTFYFQGTCSGTVDVHEYFVNEFVAGGTTYYNGRDTINTAAVQTSDLKFPTPDWDQHCIAYFTNGCMGVPIDLAASGSCPRIYTMTTATDATSCGKLKGAAATYPNGSYLWDATKLKWVDASGVKDAYAYTTWVYSSTDLK